MELPSLETLESASALVHRHLPATPLLRWPLLEQRTGCETWVKHENHNPTGAFKVRGGLVFFDRLARGEEACAGVVTATRGNHGQSVAFAADHYAIPAVVVVPEGNSADKNRAMRALGCELVEHGRDFDEAVEHAEQLARRLIQTQAYLSYLGGALMHLPNLVPGLGQALKLLGPVGGASAVTRMHLYLILEIALLFGKDIDS